MTNEQTAEAIIAWAASLLNLSPRSAPEGSWPLPDVVCAVVEVNTVRGVRGTQQGTTRVRRCLIFVLTQPMDDDSDSRMLYDSVDLLMDGLVTDDTPGRRVAHARKEASASFEPPLVTLNDDTEARQASVEITVEDYRP